MFIVAVTAAMALAQASAPAQAPAQAPRARLVSYDEAVRCAGLTQAASELEGGESRYGRALYDAALYWSLAAMQAATVAGRNPAVAEAEQTRARLDAVRRLSAGESEARAALQRCRQKAPQLG
ncbi:MULTISPECIES: hypothetical protein [Brevundimonas]|jgi:hypothetical protein|uniref:hypothetical protein n=1 Tax=Brevundimonas TaxID=41275 RepID=UPI000F779DD1|nr:MULTISPECIES: hypothetical protein [Brevundimonas]MDA0743178.1 hypothetical protein [Pseudomonadota bacterium]MBK1970104.1 hypothetical protein [Brevundimonas diminuta]MBK1977064.1 hypothetical protein [Brevundimonas diminuta]MDM8354041.1 hypothetical protein [Brevundimonas diminuta]RSB41799.1 hypothetical protein EGK63_14915 [Brevundimonas sp. 357]